MSFVSTCKGPDPPVISLSVLRASLFAWVFEGNNNLSVYLLEDNFLLELNKSIHKLLQMQNRSCTVAFGMETVDQCAPRSRHLHNRGQAAEHYGGPAWIPGIHLWLPEPRRRWWGVTRPHRGCPVQGGSARGTEASTKSMFSRLTTFPIVAQL